jgi:hypothetical protein
MAGTMTYPSLAPGMIDPSLLEARLEPGLLLPEVSPNRPLATTVETITPEIAETWLGLYPYVHQRALSEGHVLRIMRALARKEFVATSIDFASAPEGTFLLNGQHRLHAIARSGVSVLTPLTVRWHDTIQSVHDQYSKIDIGKMRQGREAPLWLLSFGDMVQDSVVSRNLYAAMGLLAMGFTQLQPKTAGLSVTVEDRVEIASERKQGILRYLEIFEKAGPGVRHHLRNTGVLAVGIVTLCEQPEKAKRFWEEVALGTYETEKSGSWRLGQFFMERAKRRHESVENARAAARCWSAYYYDQSINDIRQLDRATPIFIAGCGYTRTAHKFLLPHLAPKIG